MKSRKRGELPAVAASTDKHKLWLIIGIVLAVVLVLAIVFLSPAKEALFGKGIATGIGRLPTTTGVDRAGTVPTVESRCMDIQLLPVRNKVGVSTQTDIRQSTFYRRNVCESAGCRFSGVDGSTSGIDTTGTIQNPTNDICSGTAGNCPDISRYIWSGNEYETGRRTLCEAQGCIFTSGGTNAATGDRCEPGVIIPQEVCNNNLDDNSNGLIDCADPFCLGNAGNSQGNLCGLSEVSCTDEFDNDRDGAVDCADSDCAGVAACVTTTDTDGDGVSDVIEPVACRAVGSAGTVSSNGCPYGDENVDGCVNFDDIARIAANVDFDCPSEGHEAVSDRAGDVNADGCVNFDDVALIAQNVNFDCGGS